MPIDRAKIEADAAALAAKRERQEYLTDIAEIKFQLVSSIRKELGPLIADYFERASRTCVTCWHFDEMHETCQLTNPPARPPAKIIASGCEKYEIEIPF